MSTKRFVAVLLFLACLQPLASQANEVCGQAALKNEHKDAATIQVLEAAWSVAFLQGDTDFERCLLTADFTEIARDGSVKVLADELGVAEHNRGKNLPPPPPLRIPVMIHGDVAVAYLSVQRSKDGKPVNVYNADYFVWEQGGWHAYFSQQTQY